jgi:hypothetical protein
MKYKIESCNSLVLKSFLKRGAHFEDGVKMAKQAEIKLQGFIHSLIQELRLFTDFIIDRTLLI